MKHKFDYSHVSKNLSDLNYKDSNSAEEFRTLNFPSFPKQGKVAEVVLL